MYIKERIDAFVQLGAFFKQLIDKSLNPASAYLTHEYEEIIYEIETATAKNAWFSKDFILFALQQWADILNEKELSNWISRYKIPEINNPEIVGVVMAGNIPLVGFHDFLSVLISGNIFIGKRSSKDVNLLEKISRALEKIAPGFHNRIFFTDETLKNFDAIIATGSNNTSRYFEYYFGKYPHIIRKNRNGIAILTAKESVEELSKLADDVFIYYGLGCRSISKLYVPHNYDFSMLLKVFRESYQHFSMNHKVMNNYDYYKSVFLLNDNEYMDGDFFLLAQGESIASPIAVIHYEYYDDIEVLKEIVNRQQEQIQCIVSTLEGFEEPGNAQKPGLSDYADHVDTMNFLIKL